jgi:threonyl-tRNA synthetase
VDYAGSVAQTIKNQGFRVNTDLRNETINLKIREHALQRVPYQLIIGAREMESNTVAVRTRDGKDLGVLSLAGFINRLNESEGTGERGTD